MSTLHCSLRLKTIIIVRSNMVHMKTWKKKNNMAQMMIVLVGIFHANMT
jgi:hypothetical protein